MCHGGAGARQRVGRTNAHTGLAACCAGGGRVILDVVFMRDEVVKNLDFNTNYTDKAAMFSRLAGVVRRSSDAGPSRCSGGEC